MAAGTMTTRARSLRTRFAVPFLVALVALCTAGLHPGARLALAQDGAADAAPSEEDKALAGQLYERASVAYSQGDYEQAIEWLERAYQLDPDPVILYNLGRSYEGAARLDKAQELLEIVEQNPATPDELRQRTRTDLKRIANLLAGTLQQGQLTVTTSPDRARLVIDGRVEGTTPFAGALPVGKHTILLQKDGYESIEQEITIEKGQTTGLELSLLSLTALEERDPTGLYIGAGVALGLGAVGLGVGIGTAVEALDIHETAECGDATNAFGGKCNPEMREELDRGETLATVSVASYAVGGVAGAVGIGLLVWALVEDSGSETAAAETSASLPAHIGLDANRGTLTLGWTW